MYTNKSKITMKTHDRPCDRHAPACKQIARSERPSLRPNVDVHVLSVVVRPASVKAVTHAGNRVVQEVCMCTAETADRVLSHARRLPRWSLGEMETRERRYSKKLFAAAFTANGNTSKPRNCLFRCVSLRLASKNDARGQGRPPPKTQKASSSRVALLQPINHAARRLLRRVGAVLLGDWRGIYSIPRTLVHRVWATQANV